MNDKKGLGVLLLGFSLIFSATKQKVGGFELKLFVKSYFCGFLGVRV